MRKERLTMDIRGFLKTLRDQGEPPIDIRGRVSPEYEIGAVLKKLEGVDDRAVLFHDVAGSRFPVLANVFGTDRRIALALGLDAGLGGDAGAKESLHEFHRRLRETGTVTEVPEVPAHAHRTEGEAVDLGALPIGTFAARQTAPYLNAAVMLVRDPDTGNVNAGIYRMMKLSERALTVSVDPGHDLGKVIKRHRDEGSALDFTLVIGASPLFYLASQAKVPMTRDFYETYSAIAGSPVEVAPGVTNVIPVPRDAEIVIEGTISPGGFAPEGPYGEFSYYYGSDPRAVVCDVSLIAHRDDAVFLEIHPVHTDHRSLWLHPGREESLLRRLRELLPSVTDVAIPREGAGMQAVISIDKQHDGDPKRALMFALSSDMFIKHAVITDSDIDVRDHRQVLWALCTRFQPHQDTVIVDGVRGYMEDPSARKPSERSGVLTSKIGYDATRDLSKDFPADATGIPEGFENLDLGDYLDDSLSDRLTDGGTGRAT